MNVCFIFGIIFILYLHFQLNTASKHNTRHVAEMSKSNKKNRLNSINVVLRRQNATNSDDNSNRQEKEFFVDNSKKQVSQQILVGAGKINGSLKTGGVAVGVLAYKKKEITLQKNYSGENDGGVISDDPVIFSNEIPNDRNNSTPSSVHPGSVSTDGVGEDGSSSGDSNGGGEGGTEIGSSNESLLTSSPNNSDHGQSFLSTNSNLVGSSVRATGSILTSNSVGGASDNGQGRISAVSLEHNEDILSITVTIPSLQQVLRNRERIRPNFKQNRQLVGKRHERLRKRHY